MIHNSEAQPRTDPDEAKALNAIFAKWGVSAHSSWNISGEPCSGKAIGDLDLFDGNFNPFIKCDCLYNNKTLCHITHLKIVDRNATGKIPPEIQILKELKFLVLDKNYITGPLPAFIGNLTKLVHMNFVFNALYGPIPKEIGNLQNIIFLSVADNNFSGSLPSQMGNLKTLQRLFIDSAGLSGEIPSTFANLTDMKTFFASDNNFTGKLPDFMGYWTKLEDMRIQGNAFQGPIPSKFSRFSSILHLRIGELSNASSSLEFTKNLTLLVTLMLRNCMITGSLPSYVGMFQNVQHLDLSFNNISGTIPQSLFDSTSLVYLFLGNNNLSGVLPSSKRNQLNVIDLSYNSFSGDIPNWAKDPSDPNLQLNLVANNFAEDDLKNSPYTGLNCIQRNFPCNRDLPKYSNFAINSGGLAVSGRNINFEADNRELGPASFYVTNNNNWAVSSHGRFLGDRRDYIQSTTIKIKKDNNVSYPELLMSARLSASSIRYYGLGLENGNYSVTLQFAELDYAQERTWHNLQRRVFDIYIQGVLKEKEFDIKKEAGGPLLGVSKDYKQIQVIENMMEIHLFWAGKGTCCIPFEGEYGPSISAVNVVPEFNPTVGNNIAKPKSGRKNIGVIVGILVALGLIILLTICVALILRIKMNSYSDKELQDITFRAQTFSYAELKTATDSFNKENKLGEGGFGPVYKGMLSDGRVVAVKQLSLLSRQGKSQFVTEIDMISVVQHRNLVKLYGCCIEGNRRMLVYEYLENNSLDQALFGEKGLDMDWKTRFEICVGTARGLAYLHEESQPRIVHRDIKASNILLDSELTPKISDFGLAKLYDNKKTHMSTGVAGTFGYVAPEYAIKGHLSEKADVFGFGVVLFEILSGRPNFVSNLSPKQTYLLEWAWFLHENSRTLELIDSKLKDFNEEEVTRVFTIAFLCTQFSPSLRPTMSYVVSMLIGHVEVPAIPSKPAYLSDLDLNNFESFPNTMSSSTISTSLSSASKQSRWHSESTSEERSMDTSILRERWSMDTPILRER